MRQRRALYASEEKFMSEIDFVSPQDERYALKAVDNGDGTATLKGLGIVFDEPGTDHRDFDGQYFTDSTDFGPVAKAGVVKVPSFLNHGVPLQIGEQALKAAKRPIGAATLTKTGKGWLYELIADLRDDYQKMVAEAAEAGKLGLSAIGLLPEAKSNGEITQFVISEMGPTPHPAEPRTSLMASKSWKATLCKSCGCGKGKSCGCNRNRKDEDNFPEVGQIIEPTADALSDFLETPFPQFGSEAAVAREAKRLGLTDPSGYAEAKRMQWEQAQRRAQREWSRSLIQDLNSLSFAH